MAATQKGELRKFLQAEGCYDADLEGILIAQGINAEDDLAGVDAKQWDEIYRQAYVTRVGDIKDSAARQRLEKKMNKLKAIWRKKSGIKATNIKKGDTGSAAPAPAAGSRAVREEALSKGQALKKFMQAQGFWEIELFIALVSFGCEDGEDLPTRVDTIDKFDEVIRLTKVARAGDTTDSASRQRLEKLLSKFETHWRKATGIKKTNVKKKKKSADDDEKAAPVAGSRAVLDEALAQGRLLKKFMQKGGFWEVELFISLTGVGCTDGEDIPSCVDTIGKFDEVIRQTKVARAGDTTDSASRQRLEKLLQKFETHWRKETGIKKTNLKKKKKSGADAASSDAPAAGSRAVREEALAKGRALKKFMQAQGFWEIELFIALVSFECTEGEDIPSCVDTIDKFDEVIRLTKVARAGDTTDSASRQRLEKLLQKFETHWRKATGIKKTSQKKKKKTGGKKKGAAKKSPRRAAIDQMAGDGKELKDWMRKNNIWEKDLFNELMTNHVLCEGDLKHVTQKQFDEIVRKVRVQRFTELKDTQSRKRLDKKLVTFEGFWRKQSGIKKTSIQKKKKGKK